MTKPLFFSLLVLLSTTTAFSATLFKDGKTDYVIVVSQQASVSEKTAAQELGGYLREISGAQFAITDDASANGKHIFVGYSKGIERLGIPQPNAEDDAFRYFSAGADLHIFGGSKRGTMYGVYSFLENELGVRWYTAEHTKVPKLRQWKFKKLQHSEAPTISYRYTMYYRCADDKKWAAHNKNNFYWNAQRNEFGGQEACFGAHTLGELLPADEYFAKHPEFFALKKGKRQKAGQRCLSNKQVLDISTKRMMERIEKNPDYMFYDLSQLDNYDFCECGECRKIEAQFGGEHSGLIIWFVNQVAEKAAQRFPGKKLCTFAYLYSRHAPKNIRPRENVVVRLCDIECCFAHPLASCPENKSFLQDLKNWSRLTDNLFIWDYVVNFRQYIAPYPNFSVLAENIKTFKKNGARIVLEQGQRQSYGGEFGDLKAWVLSKLLWNPDQDADALARQFIKDNYGKAAPEIQKYFQLCQKAVKYDTHIYQNKDCALIFPEAFLAKSETLLDKALKKAESETVKQRVEDVRAQVLCLRLKLSPAKSKLDGTEKEFREYIQKRKPHIWEGQSAEEFLKANNFI